MIIHNVNDAPTIRFNGENTWNVNFTEGHGAVFVATNIEVADEDEEDILTSVVVLRELLSRLYRHVSFLF